MPVHGINDYTVPEGAEDYRHLKAIKHDFNGLLLKEAFVIPDYQMNMNYLIKTFVVAFLIIVVGLLLPATYIRTNEEAILNGEGWSSPLFILSVVLIFGGVVAEALWIQNNDRFWEYRHFERGYTAYLEGYLAVLTVMEDHYWGIRSPATVDLSIAVELGNRAAFSKYANDAALNEAWTYGMYHALKFFLPSRPEDIVAVLREALIIDDAYRDEDIFGWEMHGVSSVGSLIKMHQMFMTKNQIYARRYKFYRSIYPNGYDGKGPNTNADEIKTYVDSDGEIYRYKTEDELNRIKQKGKGINLKKEK